MRLKYILTMLVLAFPAYTVARHCALKYFQWQAFYKLEEEVLAEVTSDDFLERVLEIGPEYSRAEFIALSGFGHGVPVTFGEPKSLFKFLEDIHPQSRQSFTVLTPLNNEFMNIDDPGAKYYAYPVTVCGDRFCEFDKSKLALAQPDGERPEFDQSGIGEVTTKVVDGFDFEFGWGASVRPNKKLVLLSAGISMEAVSWFDRLAGRLTQKEAPHYWNSIQVYYKNYVMDWEAYRGE